MALTEDMVLHKLKCAHSMLMLSFVLGSGCRTNKTTLTSTCPQISLFYYWITDPEIPSILTRYMCTYELLLLYMCFRNVILSTDVILCSGKVCRADEPARRQSVIVCMILYYTTVLIPFCCNIL
jgi:hypothetical protein